MKTITKIKKFGEALDFLGKGLLRMIDVGINAFALYQLIIGNWEIGTSILLMKSMKK